VFDVHWEDTSDSFVENLITFPHIVRLTLIVKDFLIENVQYFCHISALVLMKHFKEVPSNFLPCFLINDS